MSNITTDSDQTEELTALKPKKTDTRSVILAVSAQLFARNGYKGTTLEMVAKYSQIKKQSVLYHVNNKAMLCEATLDWFIEDMDSRLSAIISEPDNDLVTKVNCFRQTLQSLLLAYEGHYLPLTLVTELALQDIIRSHYERLYDLLSDLRHLFCQTRNPDLVQKIMLQLFGLFGVARLLKPLEIGNILSQIMSQMLDA